MARYFDKNKDYSLAIQQAQKNGASRAEINRLQQERQNKIDAVYGGKEPTYGSSDKTFSQLQGSSHRDTVNNILSQPGGKVPVTNYDGSTGYLTNRGKSWDEGVDYAAEAEKYAAQGNWAGVDDMLMRRGDKIRDLGLEGQFQTNHRLSYDLQKKYGGRYAADSWEDYAQAARRHYGDGGKWGDGIDSAPVAGGVPSKPQEPEAWPKPGYRPEANSPESYLQSLYDQRQREAEARLRAQFEQDAAALRAHGETLGELYEELRNRQAAQNELEKLRMNELGASRGLSSGAFGQLAQGQSSVYQSAFADIGKREAADAAQTGWKLQQLESAYRGAVEQAKARGESELMDKLYREYVRRMEAQAREKKEAAERQEREARYRRELEEEQRRAALERAKTLAKHGDFSGYADLGYSEEEIAAMKAEWVAGKARR